MEQDNQKLFPVHHSVAKALILSGVAALVIAIGLLLTPSSYEASVLINFSPSQVQDEWDLLKDETRVIDFDGQIRSRAVLGPALEEIKSDPLSSQADQSLGWERFFSETEPSAEQKKVNAIDRFQRHLTVERIRHSSLLRISVKMDSPEMAAKAANAIARSFFNLNRQQYLEQAQKKIDAMGVEIDAVQADLSTAMNKRNAILKQNSWDDYNAELMAATNRVAALKQKLMEVGTFETIDILKDTDNKLSKSSEDSFVLPSQSSDGFLNQLIQKMNEIDARALQIKSRYKENSPPVLQIVHEKNILKDSIREYIISRVSLLSTQLQAAQKDLQALLSAAPQVQSLGGAIDHAEKRYQELMGQRSSIRLQIEAAQKDSEGFGELRLLDRAVAPQEKTFLQKSFRIGVTVAASFLILFCLLMIVIEVWNQAVLYLASPNSRSWSSSGKIL